jgi:hypothetical protein
LSAWQWENNEMKSVEDNAANHEISPCIATEADDA